jgi:predicted dehydrogenase
MNTNLWRVAQVGCGYRGVIHLDGWLSNPSRFRVEALCDLDLNKVRAAVASRGCQAKVYDDAERMLAEVKPDVFCFSTMPDVRLSMIRLAVKYGVKAVAFEKPLATSLKDAREIVRLCREAGIIAIVCHQQKYLTSFEKLKAVLDRGEIGTVIHMDASCQMQLSQLGTHFIDYLMWANGGAKASWVVGHVHGRELLSDHHPSPNYTMGQIGFANGVRAMVEFGKLSASYMDDGHFWYDNRMTVYGSHGYVWCDTNGRWGTFNKTTAQDAITGEGDGWEKQSRERLQGLFAKDLADCLDGVLTSHPCNLELAYLGYEIMEALCLSAMDRVRIDLPLDPLQEVDILERMRNELPECHELAK